MRWNAELAKAWIARQNDTELYFYCDGHVRVYHGNQTVQRARWGLAYRRIGGMHSSCDMVLSVKR
jgi:hypothetical protein